MPRRRLALLLVVVGVVVCAVVLVVVVGIETKDDGDVDVEPLASPYEVPREPHGVSHGLAHDRRALDQLSALLLDPASTNDWINTWMASVKLCYSFPSPPPGTPLYAPSPGTPEDDRRPVTERDLDAHAEEQGWPDEYVQEVRAFRRDAERLYVQALTLQKIDPDTNSNTRDAVNIRAAQLLGETGNPDLSDDIIEALEQVILKAEYEVSERLYDEAFAALGRLGNQDALEWMAYRAHESRRSPPALLDQLNASHKAMLLFDRELVPGGLRYFLVSIMWMNYAPDERGACGGDERAGEIWSEIGPEAIRVVQYFSFDPVDEDGQPLVTMHELAMWFLDHEDPAKPPWTNE